MSSSLGLVDSAGGQADRPAPATIAGIASVDRQHEGSPREALRRFLLVCDFCLVWLGSTGTDVLLAAYAGSEASSKPEPLFFRGTAGFLLFFSVLIVLLAHAQGLYEAPWKRGAHSDLRLLGKCVIYAALISGICIYLLRVETITLRSIVFTAAASWVLLAAWRMFVRSQSISGLTGVRNVAIVGCGANGRLLRRHLEQNPHAGFVFKGYIDRRQAGRRPDPSRNPEEAYILGSAQQFADIVRKHFIDEVLISVPSDRSLVKDIMHHARSAGLNVRAVHDLYETSAATEPVEYVGSVPAIALNHVPVPTLQFFIKRLIDIVVSASLLLVLMPLLVVIAIIIRLESPGPVLYVSDRVGRKGEKFRCYKLRTMSAHADHEKEKLRNANERQGPFFKMEKDPRITRFGRWLRKVSLDETPQLWNVLRGDMSLVGPRPHPVDDCARYSIEHLRRLDVTPGLTGLWQVTARRDPSFETNLALDLEYIVNWSLGMDCRILVKTVGAVLSGTGQ
jgi:exopolysaccharide biosynthesis polyprenyl glycosylphosphotransferase